MNGERRAPPPAEGTSSRRRPAGVTALLCLFVLGTVASGLSVVSLLTPGGPLEPMWRLNPAAREAFSRMGAWAPLLLGVVCGACVASAYGFSTGKRWGYRLGASLLALNLAGDLLNSILGIDRRAAIGIPIAGLLLWYLASRGVRDYFGLPSRRESSRA
jgi:hypothetical protein